MSTKKYLKYSDDFSLFTELSPVEFSIDDGVYLQLDKAEFTASPDSVMVRIPIAVWEYIREAQAMDFSLVEISDNEILKKSLKEVEEAIKAYKDADGATKEFLKIYGSQQPKSVQLQERIAYYRKERAYQIKIKEQIDGYKKAEK